jgi:hypothetical protein
MDGAPSVISIYLYCPEIGDIACKAPYRKIPSGMNILCGVGRMSGLTSQIFGSGVRDIHGIVVILAGSKL